MAATAPLLGIDPKLYRHFAAVTLVISLSVAMFASGDAANESPGSPTTAEKVPAPQPTVTLTDKRKAPSPPPPADSGDESEFFSEEGLDSSQMPDTTAASAQPQPTTIQIELDPSERARMTPQQQEAALKELAAEKKRREAQGPYRPTALELRQLRNASALRSGSNGDD